MKHRLLRIYWTLFGWPDLPPRFVVFIRPNPYTGHVVERRAYKMAALWNAGFSVEEIANKYSVTNERVKQCIWKAYRESVK